MSGDVAVRDVPAPSPEPAPESPSSAPGPRRMSDALGAVVARNPRLAEALLLAGAALLAWILRFVQDDAFITYRFSRNLARGEGLVFNPGEQVEGYTNFLYAVIHAVPEELGWSTPMFGIVFGIAVFVVAIAIFRRIVERLFDSVGFSYLAAIVLVANVTFTAYGTGGMETMTQAMLLLAVTAAVLPAVIDGRELSWLRLLGAGVLAGLAMLTRLDSTVFLVGLFLAVAWRQWSPERSFTRPVRSLGLAGLATLVVVAPWFVWKQSYYGNLLPNTFYAKSGTSPLWPVLVGIAYIAFFLLSYGAFMLVPRLWRHGRGYLAVPGVAALATPVVLWCLYVMYVGADFMEYRFMVVPLPLLAVLAAYLVDRYTKVWRQVLVVGVMLAFSAFHAAPVRLIAPVHSIEALSHWPRDGDTSWMALGESLHEWFPGGPDVEGQPVLALSQLGVIAYYADLPTVDMLGLTDAWVARNGDTTDVFIPGHVRMAPPSYLERRGVDLVLGVPQVVSREKAAQTDAYRLSELLSIYPVADLNELPESARVLELPAGADNVWMTIYMGGNEKVDEAIERYGWELKPIDRRCDDADLDHPLVRLASRATCD